MYAENTETLVVQAPDTCTYTTGDWSVDCSDNCTITSNVNLGGNDLLFTNSGTFTVNANITNYDEIIISSGCRVAIAAGHKAG